jgi:aminopeptidase-like protein
VLNQSDGANSLVAIAEKSKLAFELIAAAADALVGVELLRAVEPQSQGRQAP